MQEKKASNDGKQMEALKATTTDTQRNGHGKGK
jgi:hypothetical protein